MRNNTDSIRPCTTVRRLEQRPGNKKEEEKQEKETETKKKKAQETKMKRKEKRDRLLIMEMMRSQPAQKPAMHRPVKTTTGQEAEGRPTRSGRQSWQQRPQYGKLISPRYLLAVWITRERFGLLRTEVDA
jgi:hypothetical protein